ncbi:MAG: Smr/MutS family protein, partial [Anaerolineales bacterium]|nr:Smr/MutS family protein [Anaerolineales bacterium]
DDIRKERNRTSREREKLEKARAKLEAQTRELEKRLEKIEDERRDTLAKARAEGELEVAVLKRNIDSLKSQLKKASQPLTAIRAIEEKMEKIGEKVEQPIERLTSNVERSTSNAALKLGEKVTVSTLNAEGVVTALSESDAEVQIGTIRVRARMSELFRKSTGEVVESKVKSDALSKSKGLKSGDVRPSTLDSKKSPGMEVDLRGLMSEDALDKMERYLEQAYLAGLPFVRIIHGKGTGRLRQAVREALKGHAYVKSFEEGGNTEGGEGVTVAKLNAG